MPISTVSMAASHALHSNQKMDPPAPGNNGMRTALHAPSAAGVKAEPTLAPATKSLDDAKADVDKPTAEQVAQSLEDINKAMAGFSISVQFKVDPDYKELIVKVVDQDTGKLIRQIPTEEVVKISKAMDSLKGLLFAQSA